MRKRLIVALCLAAVAVLAVSGVATAVKSEGTASSNGVNQTLTAEVSKDKVVKKFKNGKGTPVDLTVGVAINTDGGTRPPASRQVDIGIGTDKVARATGGSDRFLFNPKGLKTCDETDLENQSTSAVESNCKGAVVGAGESAAACSATPNGIGASFPGETLAINGGKQGKNLILWLHAYTNFPTGPVATVLKGVVNTKNVLSVPVEVLGEGSCGITSFFAKIKGKVKNGSKSVNYVQAACPDKTWPFGSRFQYYDNPYNVPELSPSTALKCKGS
jgi:hypothetical protein